MSKIINCSINVVKIDKSKIIEGKNGAKYINVTIGENRDGEDQYGNTHYLFQGQSKEEREAKQPKNYLGIGKEFIFSEQPQMETQSSIDEDIPF